MNIRKSLRFVVLIAIILLQVSFMASAWAADSSVSSVPIVLGIPTVPPIPNTIGGVVTNEKNRGTYQVGQGHALPVEWQEVEGG